MSRKREPKCWVVTANLRGEFPQIRCICSSKQEAMWAEKNLQEDAQCRNLGRLYARSEHIVMNHIWAVGFALRPAKPTQEETRALEKVVRQRIAEARKGTNNA